LHPALIPVPSFRKDSPVTAYWLVRCEGFGVRCGRRRGVVEKVGLDAETHRATALVVRFGLRRRTLVPADAVEQVVPADRTLVVHAEDRPARGSAAAGRARAATGRAARVSAAHGRAAVTAGGVALAAASETARRVFAWLVPALAQLAWAAARGALLVVVWTTLGALVIVRALGSLVPARAGRRPQREEPRAAVRLRRVA
jgi:hypothetical protein